MFERRYILETIILGIYIRFRGSSNSYEYVYMWIRETFCWWAIELRGQQQADTILWNLGWLI